MARSPGWTRSAPLRGLLCTLLLAATAGGARSQQVTPPRPAVAPAAALPDETLIALFNGLRVADVVDGMDVVGLRGVGLVDTRYQALWRDTERFDHQIHGIALTVRYVPNNRVVPNPIPADQFARFESEWYDSLSSEPFVPLIKAGSVIVIDASGNGDVGSMGSLNGLYWVSRGARGVVTTGSIRDTDEIIKERIPVYSDPLQRGRGIRPGRNMVESFNQPVEIGGALVRPGDVIVADGDGVVVVPREYAAQVAKAALSILSKDKLSRRGLYQQLNRPTDKTVQP